jgi:nitrite reductase (NADH) large subunit
MQGDCVAIDRSAKEVVLRDERRITYDRLILANGSHPFVPPLLGATREGVHTFRTLQDTKALLAHAAPGKRCVCIGGGLLGLEAAGALRKRGCEVVVLEGFGWLLPRQLAEPAGRMLQSHLVGLGIEVHCDVRVKELVGDECVRAVKLHDDTEIAADFVVLATGVRPNSYLARRCGLEVEKGVVVNDRMETSDPSIYAVGDLVEHRGQVPGLWPFSYAHGAVAGANAAGGSAEFHGMPASNQLKVLDVHAFSVGQIQPLDGSYRLHESTDEGGYVRLVCRDGRLVGANLYGDATLAAELREAVESGKQILELTDLMKKMPALREMCERGT